MKPEKGLGKQQPPVRRSRTWQNHRFNLLYYKHFHSDPFGSPCGTRGFRLPGNQEYLLDRTDATNIFPDRQVYYRARVGEGLNALRQTQSQDPNEFVESVKLQSSKGGPRLRLLKKGAQVVIMDVYPYVNEVRVDFSEAGGSKAAIYFKLKNENYTAQDLGDLLQVAFAKDESELQGSKKTIKIDMGMSIEEIIKIRGKPNAQVNLGPKTVLTYDDMKLIFQDNKLVDVQ